MEEIDILKSELRLHNLRSKMINSLEKGLVKEEKRNEIIEICDDLEKISKLVKHLKDTHVQLMDENSTLGIRGLRQYLEIKKLTTELENLKENL